MWKPGTRVEFIGGGPRTGGVTVRVEVGRRATVVDAAISERNAAFGADFSCYLDGHPRVGNAISANWRPLDTNDSTGITSVEQLVQSLKKPTTVRA